MPGIRGDLRIVRVNAQGLKQVIVGLDGPDDTSATELTNKQATWSHFADRINEEFAKVEQGLQSGEANADIDDAVEEIRNSWFLLTQTWTSFKAGAGTQADRQARVKAIDAGLDSMVKKIGFLTIPQRVADFIAEERTGGVFNFFEAFKDELPVEADRVELLRRLAGSPGRIYGIIDVDQGLIYAFSRDPRRRLRSYGLAIAAFVIGFLLAAKTAEVAKLLGVGAPFANRSELAGTYVVMAFGVVVHIGLDLRKRVQSGDPRNSAAIDDLLLWVNAHELQVLITILEIWGGTLLLAAAFPQIEPLTALFAGYSLDSVIDTGLARFTTIAAKGAQDLTATIAQAGAPG